jgi:hypothetical protein
MAGGIPATNVARWDGKNWSALAPGIGDSNTAGVGALAAVNSSSATARNSSGAAAGVIWLSRLPFHAGLDLRLAFCSG